MTATTSHIHCHPSHCHPPPPHSTPPATACASAGWQSAKTAPPRESVVRNSGTTGLFFGGIFDDFISKFGDFLKLNLGIFEVNLGIFEVN
jgi:hypothetical protein